MQKLKFYRKRQNGAFIPIPHMEDHEDFVDMLELNLKNLANGEEIYATLNDTVSDIPRGILDRTMRLMGPDDNLDQFITWVEWLLGSKETDKFTPREKEVIMFHLAYYTDINCIYGNKYWAIKKRLISILKGYDPEVKDETFVQKTIEYDIPICPVQKFAGGFEFFSVYSPNKILQTIRGRES